MSSDFPSLGQQAEWHYEDEIPTLPAEAGEQVPEHEPGGPWSGIPTLPGVSAKPQPGFIWSLLLCVLFMWITQFPGAIVAIGVLFLIEMVGGGQSLFSDQAGLMASDSFGLALMPAMLITELLVIGASWLALRFLFGKNWTRLVALRLPSLAHLGLVLLAFPGLVLLGNGSFELFKHYLPSLSQILSYVFKGSAGEGISGMEQMARLFGRWPWVFAVLVIGLGPGIGEELWCRAFLGRGLVGRYGVILGVVLTSFFFGLIHLDPQQGAMAMLMGLVLHFVYLTTRSLLMPMLLHFLNNSLAVVASRIPIVREMDNGPAEVPIALYAAGALLLLAVGWALYKGRARLVLTQDSIEWRPPFLSVEYPPPRSSVEVARPHPGWPALAGVAVAALGFVAIFVHAAQQFTNIQ
jgi:membrane protease YdiL (CAAX protease family)